MKDLLNISMYEFCLLHSRSNRAIRVLTARQLEKFDLTIMEWLLLATVCDAPTKGIAMSGVAQTLDVTLPQITALAMELVQKKLIKQKVNTKDRRSRQLTPTYLGKKTIQLIDIAVNNAMRDWLGDIPTEQLQMFADITKVIATEKAQEL